MTAPGGNRGIGMSQGMAGGILLVVVAVFAYWAVGNLQSGTLANMGPAMLPRILAVMLGLCGVAMIVLAALKPDQAVGGFQVRAAVLVPLAIVAFALTIRPVAIGGFTTPGLGLLVAGPLAIVIGGYATPEARLRDLLVLACLLTPFCMVLFGDLLNLPIPVYPDAVRGMIPAGWGHKAGIRLVAAIMAGAGFLLLAAILIAGRTGGHRRG